MIPELKYTGPVVIPTIYHTYEVNYRPSHLLNDARIPAGHVSQWGLHNVPTGTWKPKNQGESRLNVESRKNTQKVRISKPPGKETNEEALSKSNVDRSGKESDIDKKKDMKTQSLQAQKDMNDNMSLEEREKVNDVGEVLNEQQEHRELKTTPAIDENKNQNHVLTQLRTHNSDSSQMRSQTLKFDSENINLAKELSKLDPQETNSNNQRFSKGKTLMDNVQFSKTNGKGSADRIMHKALKDDVFISSSLSETASKSQKDNKIEHLSSSSARELSSFPDSRDIDNSKSFESISLKNKINKKITNPITRDGETVETPQPTSNYKFALLSQKVEPNKSSNFNKFSALINKPAENNRETSHQGKEQLSVDEAFIEISNLNKMTAKLSRLPKSSAKSASQEKNGFKQERANKASQKNNVNDSKISESERSQLNVHNEYNSRLKNDRTSKKHKKSESYQVDYKSLLIDAVKEKNDNVQIFDNYHEETAEIGKSTKDLLKRPTEEINIKNKNPIKEQSENLELKSAPSAVNKKTDEAKNLQKEASEDLEDIKQAKTLAIKELNQVHHNELLKVQSKKSKHRKNKKLKKAENSENKKEVLDEDITKILAWINEPGNKIPTFNKLNSLASAEDSSSFAKPRIFTNIRNEGNGISSKFEFGVAEAVAKSTNDDILNLSKIPGSTLDRLIDYFGIDEADFLFRNSEDLTQIYAVFLLANIFQCRKKLGDFELYFTKENNEEFQKVLYFSPTVLEPAFEWLENVFIDSKKLNSKKDAFYNLVVKKILQLWGKKKIILKPQVTITVMKIFGSSIEVK
ncbi:expressed protein [Phakopsora pachyrhizi]|uniref:Expressed protein n=1 Tax=Phakopsora pachyrhizi TaxID=170000 RepID=A0AAV0AMH3_PHAPC|nr:expressed protein [Phakopsora pachyrhizi]